MPAPNSENIPFDAAVILAHGSCDVAGNHDEETRQRIMRGVELFREGRVLSLVMSGNRWFVNRNPGLRPLAHAMLDTAVDLGVDPDYIHTEDQSLDTISNAYCTKKNVFEPLGMTSAALVTSPSHSPRATDNFRFVWGSGYNVTPFEAAEAARKAQKPYEIIGTMIERMVLGGLKPGDDEAIKARLDSIIPGFNDTGLPRIALNGILGLPRTIRPVSY